MQTTTIDNFFRELDRLIDFCEAAIEYPEENKSPYAKKMELKMVDGFLYRTILAAQEV